MQYPALHSTALFHVTTHAFFKAGLFLGAGSVIHALNQASRHTSEDFQDIRNLGGLAKRMPITFFAFAIAGSGLAGIPFSAGFLSKDALLSGLLHGNFTFFIIGSLVSILTVIYTFRLIWFIFFAKDSVSLQIQKDSIADPPMIMRIVTIILAVTSLWFMVSWSPVNFSGWIYQLLQTKAVAASEIITIVSALLIIITGLSAYFYFRNRSLGQINSIASGDFGVDLIYNRIFVASSLKLADAAHTMDRKWIDGLLHVMASLQVAFAHLIGWWDNSIVDGSVDGLAMVAKGTGSITRSFSSGKIQSYILWSMLGLIIFIVWILL